jgi:hypothetical protein
MAKLADAADLKYCWPPRQGSSFQSLLQLSDDLAERLVRFREGLFGPDSYSSDTGSVALIRQSSFSGLLSA